MSFFRRRKEPRVHLSTHAASDVGRTREHNEDCFLVADLTTPQVSPNPGVFEHDCGSMGSLFTVADGMGGAAAGEVASSMATASIYEHLMHTWREDPTHTPEQFTARLREAVEKTNSKIHSHAQEHPERRGMGTTVTAAGILNDHAYLIQVGDSRAYLIRGGHATQLTKDQSLMQRLVDAGELTEEEAERSQRRNIILQALGPEPRVHADLTHQPLRRGDVLVLCSDGLSGQVSKEEIASAVSQEKELSAACAELIDLANERGGPDNITVIVVRVSGDALKEATRADLSRDHADQMADGDASARPVSVPGTSPPPAPEGVRLVAATAAAALIVALALVLSGGVF